MNNFHRSQIFFCGWWGAKDRGFPLFLRGVLRKVVCRTWFFAGENVVNCVVNVVR